MGNVESLIQLLAEEKFAFQISISKFVYEHDILSELIINLDQTPLSYILPGNTHSILKVLVKGIDDKRQITTTFGVSATGDFLPMQLIYTANTKRCLPNFDFSRDFNVTFTKNHWCNMNMEKAVQRFEKVIFHSFRKPKIHIVTQKSKCL